MATRDFELVIVGGGPAGAATALFLCAQAPALAGRIAVFDKASFPRDKICAGAIGGRADKALAAIGVRVDVAEVAVRGLHVRTGAGELIAYHPRSIGRVVRRRQYDAALLEAVRAAGVAVHDGVGVTGICRFADRAMLSTTRGAVSAAAIVGADGVGSLVRRQLGWPKGHYHAQAVEVDTESVVGDPPADVLSFDVTRPGFHGYAWDFPTRVGPETLVCRGVYALTRGVAACAPDVGHELEQRLARLGVVPRGPLKRFAERGLSLFEPLAADRVLLVGEAAGIDPVLGEGIAQAILYGEMAARFLARCWREQDYRFVGYRRAMRSARIGTDLRLRAPAAHLMYGPSRPWIERLVTSSPALAHAGMSYFAGEPVPRSKLARAALDSIIAAGVTLVRR